jgi:hypothetical protein
VPFDQEGWVHPELQISIDQVVFAVFSGRQIKWFLIAQRIFVICLHNGRSLVGIKDFQIYIAMQRITTGMQVSCYSSTQCAGRRASGFQSNRSNISSNVHLQTCVSFPNVELVQSDMGKAPACRLMTRSKRSKSGQVQSKTDN